MGRVKEAAYAWPPASPSSGVTVAYEKPIQVSKQPVSSNALNEIASTSINSGAMYQFSNVQGVAAAHSQLVSSTAAGMQTQSTFSLPQVATHPSHFQQQPQQLPVYGPQKPSQNSSLLSPLSGGGFIFNYPPLYSDTPLPPFSRPINHSTRDDVQMLPSSPISSPLSDTVLLTPSSPRSPASPQFSNGTAVSSSELRKEKLEKYRQKRTKRNFNRPVDQARRERAQARPRDEFGHFLARKDPEKERMKVEMIDVQTQLQTWIKESQLLKDRLSAMEHQLQAQQQLNSELLHENRILWSTIPTNDVFNTLRPGTSYVDAFKEKVDLSNVELNFTDSPFLEPSKLEDLETRSWSFDPSFDFTAASLS